MAMAGVGGVALIGMMVVMVGAVIGSALGKPLLGDSEVIDLLCGVAVFGFLPYCHLRGGNVMIDFFTQRLPGPIRDWLDAIMNVLFAAVVAILAWRLIAGGIAAWERDNRSMFLQLPEWWGYAVGGVAMLIWILVCLFVAAERIVRARRGAPGLGGASSAGWG